MESSINILNHLILVPTFFCEDIQRRSHEISFVPNLFFLARQVSNMYTSFFTDSEPSLDGQVVSINWLFGGLGHGGYRDSRGYTENSQKKPLPFLPCISSK